MAKLFPFAFFCESISCTYKTPKEENPKLENFVFIFEDLAGASPASSL